MKYLDLHTALKSKEPKTLIDLLQSRDPKLNDLSFRSFGLYWSLTIPISLEARMEKALHARKVAEALGFRVSG